MERLRLHDLLRLPVTEKTQASEARRFALHMARTLGFSETRTGEVAIVVTELGNNLALHANGGEVLLSANEGPQGPYLDVLSVDRGPGMEVHTALRDGYSTAGTSGTGMGAVRRLADTFDAWSSPSGSIIIARFQRDKVHETATVGSASAPKPGETRCGDSWHVRKVNDVTAVLVADGLGHGEFAANASNEAVSVFQSVTWQGAAAMIEDIHAALRSTRGAAVAVAAIDPATSRVTFSGLGNISASLLGGGRSQSMVSMNGTAGHQASRIREFEYAWPPAGKLVMHSDGITTSWNLDRYPGVLLHHPAIVAGLLYRDFSRGRDDVTAVVVSEG